MDLDEATSELYALTPADFTARRTGWAARARDEAQPELAREIGKLRRPTMSAWLVNQLARGAGEADDDMEQLEALGADLREAQARLDGTTMKDLTRRRHQLVASLVRRAGEIAGQDGQKISPAVQRELEETFGAAVADERASRAVTSGRLTRALAYAGLGEVDLTAATATSLTGLTVPRRRSTTTAKKSVAPDDRPDAVDEAPARATAEAAGAHAGTTADTAADRAADAARERHRQAVESLEQARADEAEAAADLDRANTRRDEVRAEEARLTTDLDELQKQIVRLRHELDGVTRSVAAADRDAGRRQRQLEAAQKITRKAVESLERQK